MDPPEPHSPPSAESQAPGLEAGAPVAGPESDWLGEIVARLGEDPEECWPAFESLSAMDEEIRVEVIAALSPYRDRPGVRDLLGLLEKMRGPANVPAVRPEPSGRALVREADRPTPRIARSLVTAIDGEGRGTIVLSAIDRGFRHTAAFHCDVRRGILDAVGEVEEDHPSAGRMVDEWIRQGDEEYVLEAPELAVRLLEGCLRLSGPGLNGPVRAWLEATIGPIRLPMGAAATFPGPDSGATPDREMAVCAGQVLDACPSWLDRSTLTYELAEEIALREGSATPDPVRDAGAYRYLFEHLLIDRLDLYARMLLWMAWLWQASGRIELARSAFALAAQLSEEQYAVPSHPFAVVLTTRSLLAAQAALRAAGRPVAGG